MSIISMIATLLLQHGLLYVYITYRHHVNKRLSIYYAVKRTIAQKFNPLGLHSRLAESCTRANYINFFTKLGIQYLRRSFHFITCT